MADGQSTPNNAKTKTSDMLKRAYRAIKKLETSRREDKSFPSLKHWARNVKADIARAHAQQWFENKKK